MKNRNKAIVYASGLSSICICNKVYQFQVGNDTVDYICKCYLNDFFGSVVFLLYICIALSFFRKDFVFKLIHVESIMLLCGVLWEYITPLYRSDTVSDPIDIFVYMFGGLLFWYVCDGSRLMNNTN